MKNYRPISNLSFISKLIERAVATEVNEHVHNNKLGEPLQSAYRPLHSTETALLRVKNDILRSIDDHKAVALVLLDLYAAFDTVDHTILIQRLEQVFGLEGLVLSWLDSQ